MPELPEVETVARALAGALPGQTIMSLEVLLPKSFAGDPVRLVGLTVTSISRRAKMVLVGLSDHSTILIHLKMTGQLIYLPDDLSEARVAGGHPTMSWIGQLPDAHTRVQIKLTQGKLFFNDQRTFGWMQHLEPEGVKSLLSGFGPDINSPLLTPDYLETILKASRRPIKVVLLDQSKLSGLGNIYVIDALNKAKIHPSRPANSLSLAEVERVFRAARQVIARGIQLGGATAADGKFVNTQGMGGKYQDEFLAYEREGQVCKNPGCSGTIIKIKLAGRGTYLCERCQR